jgi:hypothetical protein
MAAPSSG